MSGVFKVGVLRLLNRGTVAAKSLCEVQKTSNVQQACGISGRSIRCKQNLSKPKPYPYTEKPYGFIQACLDKTTPRLDENSKVILVEGPIAAGKTDFAKELACELEMQYFPEASMDTFYINPYGCDMRELDSQLPPNCRSFDVKNFLADPKNRNAARFQIQMYTARFIQYVDALAHLLSTGQGVVLDRSVYSDFVFLESMACQQYISQGARSVYYDVVKNTLSELLKPHLVIYLDVPVACVKDRIKKRCIDHEVKSKVLTDQYLTDMERFYKQHFLKDISTHAELLVYDWSNYGETEVVVEDIERIDFDRFDKHDPKMKDWRLPKEWDWCEKRMRYANEKDTLLNYFNVPRFDVPELVMDAEEDKAIQRVWLNAPGMKYEKGYNTDMGDKDILTKTKIALRSFM